MIVCGRLVRGGQSSPGWLRLEDGRITDAGEGAPAESGDVIFDFGDHFVSRGLVDVQVNGGAGFQITDGPDAVLGISDALLAHGVTDFLGTVITTSDAVADAAVRSMEELIDWPECALAGVHLEGPFLSPEYRGVHRAEYLSVPDSGIPAYYESDAIRLVTLAPELPGALALIHALRDRSVAVSLGHSGATWEEAEAAADHGASLITHLFNGMAPFHHRVPGLSAWGLWSPRIVCGLISDGFHVDPRVLGLVNRLAGDRVALTSDASTAACAAPGRYLQAGVEIELDAQGEVHAVGGGLAGGGVFLDQIVRTWMASCGLTAEQALEAATTVPATAIGLHTALQVGGPADLAVFDEALNVHAVMKAGRWYTSAGDPARAAERG
jgi:N-acetylglucosamine-6-phosphate deacetylase